MTDAWFDLSDKYESMLQNGLDWSGEDQHFFIRGRLQDLKAQLPVSWAPKRVLDFGCGIGHTAAQLAILFPKAEIVGLDTSEKALQSARDRYGANPITFQPVDTLSTQGMFDLCYVNGVFHHIKPERWLEVLRVLSEALVPQGYLALFENNPWNPGTRWVMKHIAFDKDATMLSSRKVRQLVKQAGFAHIPGARFLFFFPRILAWLRPLEPGLAGCPLGAQYGVLAQK